VKPSTSLIVNFVKEKTALLVDWFLSFFTDRSQPFVGLASANNPTLLSPEEKVLIFVSYNSEDSMSASRSKFFDYFTSSGWTILFVENGDVSTSDIRNPNFHFIKGNNRGRDLGAYRDLADYMRDYSGALIFLNSSIFWNMSDIHQIVKKCEELTENGADVVGLTDSYQTGVRHLQSYFFFFSPASVRLGAHQKAFLHVKNWKFKRAIVRYGEIPILTRLQQLGFHVSVIQPYESLKEQFIGDNEVKNIYSKRDYKQIKKRLEIGIPLNPTQHFAPILWMNLKVLKASFVDSNPANLETRLQNQ